jgi:two-component system, OmpR family, phosphate regulon sensor histidine kinase PhoR
MEGDESCRDSDSSQGPSANLTGVRVEVELRGSADATHAIVEVSDTGIGIHEDEIPQLFTRFFRAESATVHSISGTGLGLAIAKSIADAHHGSIEVDSELGVGTTMRLRLPLDRNGD